METAEILKKVRFIELKTRRLTNNVFSGEYHSSFKGKGMSFAEVRKYAPGDDVRDIHWNVTARLNEPYIKVFEEERELTLMLVVDISESGNFGTVSQAKRAILTEICAVMAFSASKNNDKVGLLLFSDQIELFVPPKKGRTHILRIIREMIEFQPVSKGTDIGHAMDYLLGVIKKQCIVFLMSDFIDDNYEKQIKIAARKYDLTSIRIFDDAEKTLPQVGLLPLLDPETGDTVWVDSSSKSVRTAYHYKYQTCMERASRIMQRNGAGLIHLNTKESYVKKLMSYFKQRN